MTQNPWLKGLALLAALAALSIFVASKWPTEAGVSLTPAAEYLTVTAQDTAPLLNNFGSQEVINRNTAVSGTIAQVGEGKEWYGGVWSDNRRDIVHLMVKKSLASAPETLEALEDFKKLASNIEVHEVDYSQKELKDTMESFTKDPLVNESEFVVQVAVNVTINRVLVKVYQMPKALAKELENRYPGLKVEASSTPRNHGEGDGTYIGGW